ncbi:MAG: hypothetical protein JF609_08195 [Verrucomicrobia bacterium]|nr:hypothetical protein [Verrucomicrobiota bacterium]
MEVSVGVSINARADFYEPLAASGTWVEVGSYGRCWHPAGVAVEWRPYCSGYWEWTDCGWYWVSDEPWAWACYHYGTWVYDSAYGWIWVPDIEWAPAWVYWRYGGGYVGWAPCAPHRTFFAARVQPSAFVFVEAGHVSDPVRPGAVIINNQTIINKTVEVTKVRRESRTFEGSGSHQVVINEGPGVAVFEKASGKKFTPVSVRVADQRTVLPEKFRQKAESKGQPNPHVTQEQPRAIPDQPRSVPVQPAPGPEHKFAPVNPPDRGPEPPVKHDVIPAPQHPPMPGGPPPGAGQEDNKGHGQGQGQGQGREKDKDRGDRGGDHGEDHGGGGGGGHGHD